MGGTGGGSSRLVRGGMPEAPAISRPHLLYSCDIVRRAAVNHAHFALSWPRDFWTAFFKASKTSLSDAIFSLRG